MNMNMNNMNNMNMNNMNNMNMNNMNNMNMNNMIMNNMNQRNNMNQMNNNMNQMNNNMNNMIQMNNNMNNINMNRINPMNNMILMNNMNMMNMNKFGALQVMNNCPYKPIINRSIINEIQDSSFINSVLQAFSFINCIKYWYNNLKINHFSIMNNINSSITKEIYILLHYIYTGQQPDSSNIILHFINKLRNVYNLQIQQDPYFFFYYFLILIHAENNYTMNPSLDYNQISNQNIMNRRNNQYMFNLFSSFFRQTQNSIISNNFTNIIKIEINCNNCQSIFNYTPQNILSFDVDEYRKYRDDAYPKRTGNNLNMDECFQCFTGGYSIQCEFCGNTNALSSMKLCKPSKVLIIAFKRNNHNFHGDIDIEKKLNINKYIAVEHLTGINSNSSYELKACVSLNNNQQFISDIYINNIWYRFDNYRVDILGNVKNDINVFEPQLLIYELEEMKNNQIQQIMMNQMQRERMLAFMKMNMLNKNFIMAKNIFK